MYKVREYVHVHVHVQLHPEHEHEPEYIGTLQITRTCTFSCKSTCAYINMNICEVPVQLHVHVHLHESEPEHEYEPPVLYSKASWNIHFEFWAQQLQCDSVSSHCSQIGSIAPGQGAVPGAQGRASMAPGSFHGFRWTCLVLEWASVAPGGHCSPLGFNFESKRHCKP